MIFYIPACPDRNQATFDLHGGQPPLRAIQPAVQGQTEIPASAEREAIEARRRFVANQMTKK
jgi:hypothetical protein